MKVNTALTCGTDLKMYQRGHSFARLPLIIGHEFAGVVEKAGVGVEGFKSGDRVVSANSAPCGECFYCKRSQGNLCDRLDEVLMGFSRPGAYSEFTVVPERIVRENMFQLPSSVGFDEAALLEPLACVVHGADAASYEMGDSVVIVGAGPIGLLHVQLANLRGAARVMVVDRDQKRLSMASKAGADAVFESVKEGLAEKIRGETLGRGADVVVEAVGRPETWELSLKLARKGGKVVLFGGCPSGTAVSFDTDIIHYGHLTLKGIFHHTPQTVRKAFDLIKGGRIDHKAIITSRSPLDGVVEALERMSRGEDLKVAIDVFQK